jgi:hypothetical protein
MMTVAEQHARGERLARLRAGPWPRFGTLVDYCAATARAVRAARWAGDVEYRWVMRLRIWELPGESIEPQAERIRARKRLAVEIAEGREHLLRRLFSAAAGCA